MNTLPNFYPTKNINTFINQGETILWTGRPNQKYQIEKSKGDLWKLIGASAFCLFFSIIFIFTFLALTYADLKDYKPEDLLPLHILRYGLLIGSILMFIAPFLLIGYKMYFKNIHYNRLKYSATDKAIYIAINRKKHQLIRVPYDQIKKISYLEDDNGYGNLSLKLFAPIPKKGLFKWEFENTYKPNLNNIRDVKNLFNIICESSSWIVTSYSPS